MFTELLEELKRLEEQVISHPEIAGDEQSVLRGLQVDLLDHPGRARLLRLGRRDRAPLRRHRRAAQEVGRRQRRRLLPARSRSIPTRTYRVTGRRGDAVYLSLTVYGGPDDGHYSERIVGSVNDRDLTFDEDGRFELWLVARTRRWTDPGIILEPDAVVGDHP